MTSARIKDSAGRRVSEPGRPRVMTMLPSLKWGHQEPTWRAARPAVIAAALKRAEARPTGNWYVLAASCDVRPGRPFGRDVAGIEVVAWRDVSGLIHAGPGACPHLGAPLCEGAVSGGQLVCRWHGLSLDGTDYSGWVPFPVHDDGVLVWVRLDTAGGERPLPHPELPPRPTGVPTLEAVAVLTGECEPEDIVANRLDPWHGAWFHPYAFSRLTVVEEPHPDTGDRFVVDVAYRLAGRAAVPVRVTFNAPGPRTVVMHIQSGEGAGSSVETHVTPLTAPGHPRPRTAVIEAVLATSGRPGFRVARRMAPLFRPLMRRAAARLWRDDIAYAERRCELRSRNAFPG